MTGTNPDDEQSVFVGDYVVAELSDGGQFTGEVTDIDDGVATIIDYAQDGSIAAQVEAPVERCRLHPRGRDSMISRLRVKVVDLDNGTDWLFVADLVGIIGLGGLAILAVVLVAAVSVFVLSPRLHRWVVGGGTIVVVGVLAWQAWTTYTVIKRKERMEAERGESSGR